MSKDKKSIKYKILGKPLKDWFFFFLLCILPLIVVFGGKYYDYYSIRRNGLVTVGVTEKITYSGQTGRYVNYSFLVREKEQSYSTYTWSENIRVPNGYYYVVFDPNNKMNSIMLFDLDVLEGHKVGELISNDDFKYTKLINYWYM